MADMTQLTGDYAAAWLPWIMIPLIFYILPFPIFAIAFLWIEREGNGEATMGQNPMGRVPENSSSIPSEVMGAEPTSAS